MDISNLTVVIGKHSSYSKTAVFIVPIGLHFGESGRHHFGIQMFMKI